MSNTYTSRVPRRRAQSRVLLGLHQRIPAVARGPITALEHMLAQIALVVLIVHAHRHVAVVDPGYRGGLRHGLETIEDIGGKKSGWFWL